MLLTMLATVLVLYIDTVIKLRIKNPYLRTLFNIAGRSETNHHFSEKTDVYITNLTFCKFIHRPCVDVSLFGIFPLVTGISQKKSFGLIDSVINLSILLTFARYKTRRYGIKR